MKTHHLKTKIKKGFFWNALSLGSTHGLSFIRSIVIARLLAPEDYGLFGMAMVSLSAMTFLTDSGLSRYLIHKKMDQKNQSEILINTVWTAEIVRYAIVTLLLMALAYPVTLYFGDKRLFPIVVVIAFQPLLTGFSNIGKDLYRKKIDFKKVILHDQITQIATFFFLLIAACIWKNAWALVTSQLVGLLFGVSLSYILFEYRPKFHFRMNIFKEAFAYGKHIWWIGVLTYITTQLDNLMVGRSLGAAVLGIYLIAYRLASLPAEGVVSIFNSVMFPVYSKLNATDPKRLGDVFAKNTMAIICFLLLTCVPMKLFAAPLVRTLYGGRWNEAIPVLTPLILLAFMRGMTHTMAPLFNGVGKPRINSIAKMLEAGSFIPAIVYLLPRYGLFGAAWAGVISYTVGYFVRLLALVKMELGFEEILWGKMITFLLSGAGIWMAGKYALKSQIPALAVFTAVELSILALMLILQPSFRNEIRPLMSLFVQRGQLKRKLSSRS